MLGAYRRGTIKFETQELNNFNFNRQNSVFTIGFCGLFGLSELFSRLMTIHFEPFIKKKKPNNYNGGTNIEPQNIVEQEN